MEIYKINLNELKVDKEVKIIKVKDLLLIIKKDEIMIITNAHPRMVEEVLLKFPTAKIMTEEIVK
ncbi:hypothetical protein J7K44_03235 [bacterium]|nr:hypothetical protein [bacterium]